MIDQSKIIDELKRNGYMGMNSEIHRRDKLFDEMNNYIPYPPMVINRFNGNKVITREFSSDEHENLKDALVHTQLIEAYNANISYYHAWGMEFFYPKILREVMNELSERIHEKWEFEMAWGVARDFVTFLDMNKRGHFVVMFKGYPTCLCKACILLSPIKTVLNMPVIFLDRHNTISRAKSLATS